MSIYYIPWVLGHTQLLPEWQSDYFHPRLLNSHSGETVDKDEIIRIFMEEREKNLEFQQDIIKILKEFVGSWNESVKNQLAKKYPQQPIFIEMGLPCAYNLDLSSYKIVKCEKNPRVILSS